MLTPRRVLSGLATALVLVPLAAAADTHVHILANAFDPERIEVALGDTVTWHTHSSPHTATDDRCPRAGGPGPCPFDGILINTGLTFTHAFTTGDVYEYQCTIHLFRGVIVVDDPAESPDLIVDAITVTDVSMSLKRIEVRVRNVGNDGALEETLRLTSEAAVQVQPHVLRDWVLTPIGIGATESRQFLWDVRGIVGDITIRATVDQLGEVGEEREDNNQRTVVVSVLTPPGVPGLDPLHPI